MAVLWGNFLAGTITNSPLAIDGSTLTSAELANLPVVSSPDTMWIILDPRSLQAGREIVLVTNHTSSSTSATISRAQQSTTAKIHPSGTEWIVGVTKSDLDSFFLKSGGTISGAVTISTGDLTVTGGNVSVGSNLTVTGNLTVNGTTTTVNSTTVTVDDPIFTLGGDTAPGADDNKDRGIEFRWHNGSAAKVGFFGFDDSTGKFTFIPDATNTSEVFSGTKGELDASVDWSNILNKPDPVVTVTLTGAVSGTANATLTDLGNGTITVSTSQANDSVTLGTHTTGQYVSDVTGTANQVTATPTGTEPRTIVLSLPQNIHAGATPTFTRLTLSQATGTAPLTVSSTTLVSNLNAEYIGGQTLANLDTRYVKTSGGGSITSGTVDFGSRYGQHLNLYSTTYGLGAQTSNVYLRTAEGFSIFLNGTHSDTQYSAGAGGTELLRVNNTSMLYKGNAVLTTADEGAGNGLDADTLDGQQGSYYLDWTNVTNKPDPVITVTLTGNVTGTGNATLTDLGNGTISFTTTIAADAVALGSNTTGQYVSDVTGTANQVTATPTGTEPRTIVLSLPQNIHTAATPTFTSLTLSQTTGTAPLTVSSTTKVTNLNADLLDGLDSTAFATSGHNHDSTYLALAGGSMTGNITFTDDGEGIIVNSGGRFYKKASGAIAIRRTTGDVDPVVEKNDGSAVYKIWHEGNDGSGSTLDADLLDGQHGYWYASRNLVESLMGDLQYVGTYNPYRWDAADSTERTSLPNPTYWNPEIQNAVLNSSFEYDSDGDGLPNSWTNWTGGAPTSTSFSIQTGSAHSGKDYFRCTATLDAAGEQYGLQQQIGSTSSQTVTAGVTYVLSAAIKGTFPATTRAVLRISWYNSSGTPLTPSTGNETPTGSWGRYSLVATAPTNSHYCVISVYSEYVSGAGGATTLDLDSVMFEQATTMADTYEPHPTESYRHGMQWIVSFPRVPRDVTNKALTSNVATLTTSKPHDFLVGQGVIVTGVDATFNSGVDGNGDYIPYTITAVTTTTFSYAKTASNVTSQAATGTAVVPLSAREVGFIDADASGRLDDNDGLVTVSNGDWIIANNPNFGSDPIDKALTISDVVFSFVPVSAEVLINQAIEDHANDPSDPHSAAGYLTSTTAGLLYSPLGHDHDADIADAILTHRTPPTYAITTKALTSNVATLTTAVNHTILVGMEVRVVNVDSTFDGHHVVTAVTSDTFSYAKTATNVGSTSATGTATINPHPEYLTETDAATNYAAIGHNHDADYVSLTGDTMTGALTLSGAPTTDLHASTKKYVDDQITAHEAEGDPHPGYLTESEAAALHYTKTEVNTLIDGIPDEVQQVDQASSAILYVGYKATTPTMQPGDLWLETDDLFAAPPGAPANFNAASPTGTSVNLSWSAWATPVGVDNVRIYRTVGAPPTQSSTYTWSANVVTITASSHGLTSNDAVYLDFTSGGATADGYFKITVTDANTFTVPLTGSGTAGNVTVTKWGTSDWSGTNANTTWADTGRTQQTLYHYLLEGENNGVGSGWGTLSITTANDSPPALSGVQERVAGRTTTQVSLQWTASSEPDLKFTVTTKQIASNVATLTTSVAHGFAIGDSVLVENVDATFNGTYTLTNVTSTTISYAKTASNTGPSAATGTVTAPYQIYKNGVFQKNVSVSPYDFTGLDENTTVTMGVRVRDNGGLTSSTGSVNATSSNATPDNISTVTLQNRNDNGALGYNSIKADWSASSEADFSLYEVTLNGTSGSTITTTALTYTFNSLAYSSSYTVTVKVKDTGGLYSTGTTSASKSTLANPDTTPPGTGTITSWKPVTSYGRMEANYTAPSDADLASVALDYRVNGGSWVQFYSAASSPSQAHNNKLAGTFSAGDTIEVRSRTTDNATPSNTRTSGTLASYTLLTSPTYVVASGASSWRNTNGGEWDYAGNGRVYQGYYTNSSYNARGAWFYGGNVASAGLSGKTVTVFDIFFIRDTSVGSSSESQVSFAMHRVVSAPSGSGYGNFPLYGTVSNPGNFKPSVAPDGTTSGGWGADGDCQFTFGEYGYVRLPAEWGQTIVDGTNKGIALYDAITGESGLTDVSGSDGDPGKPYMAAVGMSNGYSGLLRFTHLG